MVLSKIRKSYGEYASARRKIKETFGSDCDTHRMMRLKSTAGGRTWIYSLWKRRAWRNNLRTIALEVTIKTMNVDETIQEKHRVREGE